MKNLAQEFAKTIDEASLQKEPCDHLQLNGFFPEDVFNALLENLPEARFYTDLNHHDAIQPNGKSARKRIIMSNPIIAGLPRKQRRFWREIVEALRSPLLAAAYRRQFSAALSARSSDPAAEIRMFPYIMLMRDLAGYRISVHNDSASKVITTQYYLPNDDERDYLGTGFFSRDEADSVSLIKTIPFVRNSGYAFPIADNSWHGVTQMAANERPRNSLMLIYYVTPALHKRIGLAIKGSGQAVRARSMATARRFSTWRRLLM